MFMYNSLQSVRLYLLYIFLFWFDVFDQADRRTTRIGNGPFVDFRRDFGFKCETKTQQLPLIRLFFRRFITER